MAEEDIELQLQESEQDTDLTAVTPAEQPPVNPLDDIDEDELSAYILRKLQEDIADRESFGWTEKRDYDNKSYDGLKKKKIFPWKNCANFPVPLTPTLVDTAHANVIGSMFSDDNKIVEVIGISPEDIENVKPLEKVMNWQLLRDMDIFKVMDITISKAFKNGIGIVKIIKTSDRKIGISNVLAENIYMPLNATGFQVGESDHVFQAIALDELDIEIRKQTLHNGKPVYEGLEELKTGWQISLASQQLLVTQDQITGTSMQQKQSRDLYYILECYLTYTYYPKNSDKQGNKKIVELIVTIAPNGGKILRLMENKRVDVDGIVIRPYAEYVPYPREDRFIGMSLPEKIRFIQEELDYSHNQNIDAADASISPPGFYPSGSDFDPEVHQLVPGGMYPISSPGEVVFRQVSVNPIFERQEDKYWELAERLTGLTELFQGRQAGRAGTLGEAVLRTNRSEIRFGTLYKRIEEGYIRMLRVLYAYDLDLPRETIVNILGTSEFTTIEALFPEGIRGKYDFAFSSAPITETQEQKNNDIQFYSGGLANPIVQQDPGNMWRIFKVYAEALGQKNFEALIKKPKEADVLSAEEAIQKIMSGMLDIVPDAGIDADRYVTKIQLFAKTEFFANSKPEQKQALSQLFNRARAIQEGRKQLMADMQVLRGVGEQAQLQQAGGGGGNGQPIPTGQGITGE
mgnify:CR=1 FL=1